MRISLLFLTLSFCAGSGLAQVPGFFGGAGNMITARYGHTATLLPNGKVLIAGGSVAATTATASAELYDPDTGFSSTGSMTVPRAGHSATLLPDDKVLIVGGSTDPAVELYDPESGTFNRGPSMNVPRQAHTATLLNNGKVLIAGGPSGTSGAYDTAELYDPANGTFTPTGKMTIGHERHRATLIADGRVLISPAGDAEDTDVGRAEIYDPGSGSFHAVVPGQPADGAAYTANLLLNGKVLLTLAPPECDYLDTDAQIFDPASETFSAAGNMLTARCIQTGTSFVDGSVVVSGSWRCSDSADTDVYDTSSGVFQRGPSMMINRYLHQATLLADGRILVTGGVDATGSASCGEALVSRAEVGSIGTIGSDTPSLYLLSVDGSQGAVLHAFTHQVVSPANPALPGEALEIYALYLIDGAVIPPQVAIGGRLAEVLYFGKAPGYPTLNQINVRVPADVTSGPAVPVRMNYLGRPSNLVTIGVGRP